MEKICQYWRVCADKTNGKYFKNLRWWYSECGNVTFDTIPIKLMHSSVTQFCLWEIPVPPNTIEYQTKNFLAELSVELNKSIIAPNECAIPNYKCNYIDENRFACYISHGTGSMDFKLAGNTYVYS